MLTPTQESHGEITIIYQTVGCVILLLLVLVNAVHSCLCISLPSLFGTYRFIHIHAGYRKVLGFDSRVKGLVTEEINQNIMMN